MRPDHEPTFTRREWLTTLALGAAATAAGCTSAHSQRSTTPAQGDLNMAEAHALEGNQQVRPLPFDPKKLQGLSERLIVSHHENNYGGAVKNLNRVEQELAAINRDTPPFVVAALRERELTFRNSKTLHEAYFGNLGGSGRASGGIEAALSEAYGGAARWEEHFRATAMGLGGGSGWVVLAYELDSGALRTIASAGHTQALSTAAPLLVLDMYEHSYHMDFGAAAAKYIDAFFANVQWDEVNARLERARSASAAWLGRAG